jgi:hypothetical protein
MAKKSTGKKGGKKTGKGNAWTAYISGGKRESALERRMSLTVARQRRMAGG